jgi:periplasmic mercuric ion binding protein
MKTRMLSLIALFAIAVTSVVAQTEKKEEFKVAGNCGMCKTRIEKAALSVDGVSSAEWDKDSNIISVSYDSQKTEIGKVQLAISTVGHDTKLYRASDKVYDKLPGCCKYERMELADSGQQKL